jgi:hypothetical protein
MYVYTCVFFFILIVFRYMSGRPYKKKQESRNLMSNTQKTYVQRMYEADFLRNYKIAYKGPKHEKFNAGIYTQIRPVWTGE